MNPNEISPKQVLKAGRDICKRKGWFSAKDIWFELGFNRFVKNDSEKSGPRVISNLLRDASISDRVRKCCSSKSGSARYVIVRRRRRV